MCFFLGDSELSIWLISTIRNWTAFIVDIGLIKVNIFGLNKFHILSASTLLIALGQIWAKQINTLHKVRTTQNGFPRPSAIQAAQICDCQWTVHAQGRRGISYYCRANTCCVHLRSSSWKNLPKKVILNTYSLLVLLNRKKISNQ